MSLEGKSLHILTPMYGGSLTANYHESVVQLFMILQQIGVPFTFTNTYNESLISRARNRLVDSYLKCGDDRSHALFIDADIGFTPNEVLHMLELDLDVAGAACSKKSFRWDRVKAAVLKSNGAEECSDLDLARVAGDFVFNFEHFQGIRELNLGQPVEVRHLGTGLMMVRRNVFDGYMEKYPDRWYESRGDPSALMGPIHDFFRCGVNLETREYDSEDYWFCQDAKAIGFKIWMCPWVRTTHKGTYDFIGDMPAVAQMAGSL